MSLNLAQRIVLVEIAFPAISCGAYDYPIEDAARIAFRELVGFLPAHSQIERAVFVLYDQSAYDVYQRLYEEYFAPNSGGLS